MHPINLAWRVRFFFGWRRADGTSSGPPPPDYPVWPVHLSLSRGPELLCPLIAWALVATFADECDPSPVAWRFHRLAPPAHSTGRNAIFHEPGSWQYPVLGAAGGFRRSTLAPHELRAACVPLAQCQLRANACRAASCVAAKPCQDKCMHLQHFDFECSGGVLLARHSPQWQIGTFPNTRDYCA